ncbi:MAG TPA: DUF1416 domain-containing protein [Frankiaceae bacterium]|nr:DUF1416 domain-containing protein [Frankiaceae bacterium]
MCSPPVGGLSLDGVDVKKESVIQGSVTRSGQPVASAYVRLLDASDEFTAEVVTSATGHFRFFARPGQWTLRALSPQGGGEARVVAQQGHAVDVEVTIPA